MHERIIEIIVYVISELKQHKDISEIDLGELESLGYTSAEISTAFSWLVDRMELSEEASESFTELNSFRMLHEAEQKLFTRQAWGDLIQLQSLGLLHSEHIESLIERAVMSSQQQVDSRQLKKYVASMVFHAIGDVAESSRFMLDGSDTIN